MTLGSAPVSSMRVAISRSSGISRVTVGTAPRDFVFRDFCFFAAGRPVFAGRVISGFPPVGFTARTGGNWRFPNAHWPPRAYGIRECRDRSAYSIGTSHCRGIAREG